MESYLYHYTSEEKVRMIEDSGYIRPSKLTTKDAVLGEGVYFTDLPPSTEKDQLLYNNWNIHHAGSHRDNDLTWCVRIPMYELRRQIKVSRKGDRVIYCYPGQVNLRDFTFVVINVDTGKELDTSGWSWVQVTGLAVGVAAGVALLGAAAYGLGKWLSSNEEEKKQKK